MPRRWPRRFRAAPSSARASLSDHRKTEGTHMRPHSILAASFATAFALASTAVLAEADKPAHQAKIKAATQTALQKFYKVQPRIKGEVEDAPGYAIFTTYGASFGFGGSGGGGVAFDKQGNRDTFVRMAQASAGLQAGIAPKDQ